jgi:hypothetical protein
MGDGCGQNCGPVQSGSADGTVRSCRFRRRLKTTILLRQKNRYCSAERTDPYVKHVELGLCTDTHFRTLQMVNSQK